MLTTTPPWSPSRPARSTCNQQFIANVQNLWEEEGLPIATYMDEAPYGICATMPTAWYNMEIPVLQVKEVRKAIAMAVDYDNIIENAMTNQSPSFADVPRSVMNPTDGEQAMYDHDAVKDLQWAGKDIEGAKALLDEAGIVDTDGDGYRELNGEKITLNACCPNGWTDWQAAMEIVAAAGQASAWTSPPTIPSGPSIRPCSPRLPRPSMTSSCTARPAPSPLLRGAVSAPS